MRGVLALVAALLLAAGCSEPKDDPVEVTDACGAVLSGVMANISPGEPFRYSLDAGCPDRDFVATHAEVRFGPVMADASHAPTEEAYLESCGVVPFRTGFPASFDCSIADPGIYFVRGFVGLPLPEGGSRLMWTQEFVIVVAPEALDQPRVQLVDVPSRADSGEAIPIGVRVTGASGTSDHVGAHWATSSQAGQEPGTANYPSPCDHVSATLPGRFTATCTFTGSAAFVRGHVRWTLGDEVRNAWGQEVPVQM